MIQEETACNQSLTDISLNDDVDSEDSDAIQFLKGKTMQNMIKYGISGIDEEVKTDRNPSAIEEKSDLGEFAIFIAS